MIGNVHPLDQGLNGEIYYTLAQSPQRPLMPSKRSAGSWALNG